MNVDARPLVKMLGVLRISISHNGGGDDGIDFDAGNAGASVRDGAQHIDAAARADDGKLTVRPQNIGQRGRSGHQVVFPFRALPVRQVRVHDVGGRVGINDDRLGLPLAIDFNARQSIPAGELDPCGIAEHPLRIDHVDQPARVIRRDQHSECKSEQTRIPARSLRTRPNHRRRCQRESCDQNDVRSSDPVQQRHNREARHGASAEVCTIKPRDTA